jgi:hypothetical protein
MNDWRFSTATRTLLAKAKADAPSAAARAKMWAGVSTAVGAGAAASVAGPTSSANLAVGGGASAMKVLAMGALLGGAVTVGLGAVVLRFGSAPTAPFAARGEPTVVVPGAGAGNPRASVPTSIESLTLIAGEIVPKGADNREAVPKGTDNRVVGPQAGRTGEARPVTVGANVAHCGAWLPARALRRACP